MGTRLGGQAAGGPMKTVRLDPVADPMKIERPDAAAVLAGLKDFQRDSVDYIFRRLYSDADHTSKFLLADEVGLGKTLVTKGVVAKNGQRALGHRRPH